MAKPHHRGILTGKSKSNPSTACQLGRAKSFCFVFNLGKNNSRGSAVVVINSKDQAKAKANKIG